MAKKGFDLAALAREQMGDGMAQTVESVREIALDNIDVNAANFYEKSNLDELAANIELLGLIQPVAVKPGENGRWTLIDGERRYQATKLLGHKTIRAVVHRPASGVIEELMLISANMQQRKMTSADLSQQAERYTECLADLKRSGVEIPGRLRAAVAEAFGVSESRIAKLAAIRSNLIGEMLAKFDAGELNESTAYALSKLPGQYQQIFVDEPQMCQMWRIELVSMNLKTIRAGTCPDAGAYPTCCLERARVIAEAGYAKCHAGCCLNCLNLRLCGGGCAAANAKAEALTAELKRMQADLATQRESAMAEAAENRAAMTAARRKLADEQWTRFKRLREAAGVTLEEVAAECDPNINASDLAHAEVREVGYIEAEEPLDRCFTLSTALNVAELMGVSVYELAGRPGPKDGGTWEWIDGLDELPIGTEGMIACWGLRGFRTVNARDYAAALEAFPGAYDWWCVPVPPTEFKMNMEEDGE